MIGGPLYYLSKKLNMGLIINSNKFFLNIQIIILWALMYTTVHNINYRIIKPKTHIYHHEHDVESAYNANNVTIHNYNPEYISDILFNSNYDTKNIESLNHFIINIICITTLIYFVKESSSNNSIIRYFKN